MSYFGEIEGISEGYILASLPEAARLNLIANPYKGISSGFDNSGQYGADAIVLNGGYESDRDYGDKIVYTGDGGNEPGSLKIVKNQSLNGRNKALVSSYENQLPVRVIRGSKLKSHFAPKSGCRYDGIFQITDIVKELTEDNYIIYLFVFEKITPVLIGETIEKLPIRVSGYYERIVRDTKASLIVKKMYNYRCQMCNVQLSLPHNKFYAEGAHIQPLGKPYDGPDVISNILCLCPNHHVQFDRHQISINPESLELVGMEGKLIINLEHDIGRKYLAYHLIRSRDTFFSRKKE